MVISFTVKEAREHLEKHGFVYTLRPKMRKRIGKDWYNYFRTDIKRGNVVIKYMGDYTNKDLTDFVRHSGFGSLEAWLKKAGDSRHLYVVDLMFKVVKREVKVEQKDGFWASYPIENLTPEQRKHFKTIMRKEVR